MQTAQPSVKTELLLSLSLDDANGVLAISVGHAPPVNMSTTLAYKLTAEEARRLAASLTTWANAQP
jgi:hypothetical protein